MFSHVAGLTIHQARKFVYFLFGKDNVIKSTKDEQNIRYKFYIDSNSMNEKSKRVARSFMEEFHGIEIIPIERIEE